MTLKISKHPLGTYIFSFFAWTLMCVIAGWNIENPDLDNYANYYNGSADLEISLLHLLNPGYSLIIKIFNGIGVPFFYFRLIFYISYYTFVLALILKKSRRPCVVIMIYSFLQFFVDTIQMRNAMATFFLLSGLFGFIDKRIKYNKAWLIVNLFIASSIHVTFALYFLLLFADRKINVKALFCLVLVLCVSVKYFLPSINLEFNEGLSARAEGYLERSSVFALWINLFLVGLNYYIVRHSFKFVKTQYPKDVEQKVLNINLLLFLIVVPLSGVNMIFLRLFFNVLLFNTVVVFNNYYRTTQKQLRKSRKLSYMLYAVVAFMIWVGLSDVGRSVSGILHNNMLWS